MDAFYKSAKRSWRFHARLVLEKVLTLHIYCPYSEKAIWKRRAETFRTLPKFGYPWSYECLDRTTYDEWFKALWEHTQTDILIIEHDNVPTPEMVKRLDECPEPICVQDYRYSDGISVHRNIVENRVVDRIVGEEWTDLYGFGVLRIKHSFIKEHSLGDLGKQPKNEGPNLDSRFSQWTHSLGIRAHVHYPTSKHNHSTDIRWYGGIQAAIDTKDSSVQRVLNRLRREIAKLD